MIKKKENYVRMRKHSEHPENQDDFPGFENYPIWIVFISNLVLIAIYLIGALIVYKVGWTWLLIAYLIFVGYLEFKLIKGHCVNCYYYGKTCAFSKGRISSMFFKKGDREKFCRTQITWKDILPDFLVSLIPIAIGVILLIKDFNSVLLSEIIILILLTFVGNALIRGQLACKHCKQKDIGCPAEKLFQGKRK